jgi:hypothetical protein
MNIFQPANPTILPETPQISALSGAHLLDGLDLIFQKICFSVLV